MFSFTSNMYDKGKFDFQQNSTSAVITKDWYGIYDTTAWKYPAWNAKGRFFRAFDFHTKSDKVDVQQLDVFTNELYSFRRIP